MLDDGLEWIPDARILRGLRALIDGTGELDPNRAIAVDIAFVLAEAIDRQGGGAT